ncbi:MAG: hypothetical protein KKF50_01810 [Nanoarchaeota archaeon]|nr:hypothetical protein [Nanoarchaeota archaeon]
MNGTAPISLGKNGLQLCVEETRAFDRLIRNSYEQIGLDIYGVKHTPGVAVFAYGSPGRRELIGGDSDADIFLVEKERTERSKEFRKRLKEKWETFGFSKVDLPTWGTYSDIETYLEKSLVEGNQVLETRFLIRDNLVAQDVLERKKKFDSIERGLENIVFNRLYFNQYFRQRIRNGALNIKYCHGGSRDFLFVYWHDKLDRMIKKDPDDPSYIPRVESGLNRLFSQGKISEKELGNLTEAINFLIELRSDVLSSNKFTSERGLTFLDDSTLERLHSIGYPDSETTQSYFWEYRMRIENLSRLVWDETIKKAGILRGNFWEERFRKAYIAEICEGIRKQIPSDDPLLSTAIIWGASESGQKELFDFLASKYRETENWSVLGSIVCSPLCNEGLLHHFGTNQLKEKGYGYLLRVVSRNKNVSKETLKSIAEDPKLEKRYTEVAQVALAKGNEEANNQI